MSIFGKDITAADLAAGNLQGSEKEKSEFSKALRFGLDQPTENVATTLRALGFDTQADALSGLIDAPKDYDSKAAQFVGEEGMYDFSALPLAVVEQAGQLGGSLLSRFAGASAGSVAGPPGIALGAILGPGLFEAVQIAGPVALERARNNGRTEPDTSDWAAALGTATFSGVLNAIGAKNIGKLNTTLAGSGVREGSTEFLQGLTEQFGSTAGTDKGLELDLRQAGGEGLIGGATGLGAQVPTSTLQTAPQAIEKIKDLLPTQRPTTAPMAVRGMQDTTDPRRIERRREAETITQANQEFENRAPEIDPEQPSAQITDQEVQDTFLETHDEIINQFMMQDFGEVDRAVRNAGFLDVQDNIRANFELFDPRYGENSPMTVNQRIRDFIGEAMRSRIQAADTDKVVNQTVDPRFDFEAVPLNPQEDIYSRQEDIYSSEYRPFGPVTASIASAETGIDPMFLSTSTLVPFLTNLPQVMSAEQAMKTIGIKEEGNWFKPSKSEKAVTDRVREAVDSGVAEFLQQKKNQGQPVTRDEISGLFYDHLGRFQTIPTYGQETQHKDNYKMQHDGRQYDQFARLGPEADVELWTMYDARLPAGETKESSPYYNRMSDATHNPHGEGTNFWIRGTQVQEMESNKSGLVLDEIQSQIHEHGQDPERAEVYLSDVSREQEADLEPIRQKIETFENASRRFRNALEESPDFDGAPNLFASDVSNALRDNPVLAPTVIAAELGSVSPEFKTKYDDFKDRRDKQAAEVFGDILYEEQPFAEFGYPLDQSYLYTIGTFSPNPDAVAKDVYRRLQEQGFDAKELALTDSDIAIAVADVDRAAVSANRIVSDRFSREQQSLIKEYLPALAIKYPAMNELIAAGANYPSQEDQRRVLNFDNTRYETPTVPNYPYRKNWPGMAVRTGIINALENNLDAVYIPAGGVGGAPKSVYKAAQKAGRQLAQQIADLDPNTDAQDIYKVLPDRSQGATTDLAPYAEIDLTVLKRLIAEGKFTGFKGYKEGGLVMNYGDYGRSYI
jgi:hypothetical protein